MHRSTVQKRTKRKAIPFSKAALTARLAGQAGHFLSSIRVNEKEPLKIAAPVVLPKEATKSPANHGHDPLRSLNGVLQSLGFFHLHGWNRPCSPAWVTCLADRPLCQQRRSYQVTKRRLSSPGAQVRGTSHEPRGRSCEISRPQRLPLPSPSLWSRRIGWPVS